MVKLLIGAKGSGKTKVLIDEANGAIETAKGNLVFITKDQSLMYDIKYFIRVICMADYSGITNIDEYIGFIYGIISGDHDLETIYMDGILKLADISLEDIPEFINRLKAISELYEVNFVAGLSADRDELDGVDFEGVELIK